MGKAEKEKLNLALSEHFNNIHETFQVLDQGPAPSVDKVSWSEVIKMGEQVSKQATVAGMLWTGERLEVKELEENMSTYFNILQGFLLLSHGCKVGAGPTLSSSVYASVKQVVDCSFMLFKEAVSSYGSHNKDLKLSIPKLVGKVWDACSTLEKAPATNVTAVGRAMAQVAVSMKDVLREMKELKPASTDPTDEASEEASEEDLGNDLSPEEMKIAELAIHIVSDTLVVLKELIRSITGLIKQEDQNKSDDFVNLLERLLKLSQEIGAQVDELGACLYPPQEFPAMKAVLEKIFNIIDEMQLEIDNLKGSSQAFSQACTSLRGSLKEMETELGCANMTQLEPEMRNLVVSN